MKHLRQTIIPFSAGLLLCGCSSDEPAASRHEMKFDISAVSRAAVTTTDNITGSPFALFADRTSPLTAPVQPGQTLVIYDNAPVTYVSSAWTTPITQFWYDDYLYSFVAIHPASALSAEEAGIRYSDSKLTFSYTLPSDLMSAADILASTHRRLYSEQLTGDNTTTFTPTNDKTVHFTFGHIMTQINIAPAFKSEAAGENDFITFQKMEVVGCATKATYNITPSRLGTAFTTDEKEFTVAGQEGKSDCTIKFSNPKNIANNAGNVALFDSTDALIMLPQEFAADSDAKIIFTYTVNDDPALAQATLPLTNHTWEAGKSYTYRFTIEKVGAPPSFTTTTITDWEMMNVGNIDVH